MSWYLLRRERKRRGRGVGSEFPALLPQVVSKEMLRERERDESFQEVGLIVEGELFPPLIANRSWFIPPAPGVHR